MGTSTGGSDRQPGGYEEIVQFGRPRRRRAGLGSLPLALLAAIAVVAVVRHSGGQPHRPPPPPVAVTNVGHRILGVRAGWALFGLDSSGVVAVQFSRGQITRTALPLESGSPVSLIVNSDKVIVRPLDNVPGYVVPDGQPAQLLTGVLSHGALLLPGPVADEEWDIRGQQSISLVGARGQVLRTGLAGLPGRFTLLASTADGSGNVLLSGNNGQQYDMGSGVLRPVGALLVAVGPRDWLGLSCDQQRNCQKVVITAATGARRLLPGPAFSATTNWPWLSPAGVTAPDGSTAALLVSSTFGATALDLVNLTSGAVTAVQASVVPHAGSQTLAWSPDSRWLFVITATGQLAAVNPRTGHVQDLGLGLSGLRKIAIREPER